MSTERNKWKTVSVKLVKRVNTVGQELGHITVVIMKDLNGELHEKLFEGNHLKEIRKSK